MARTYLQRMLKRWNQRLWIQPEKAPKPHESFCLYFGSYKKSVVKRVFCGITEPWWYLLTKIEVFQCRRHLCVSCTEIKRGSLYRSDALCAKPRLELTWQVQREGHNRQRGDEMETKVSIRFFNDREVRAVWDEDSSRWLFSVLDIVAVLRDEDDYEKIRNYWKYLKAKLRKQGNELGSVTTQMKLLAPDGKRRMSNVMNYEQIIALAKEFPSKNANRFIEWFTYSDETIDGKSKNKAYALWNSSFMSNIEVGTVKGLKQIHAYLFGGLYDFAGQIRSKEIAKGGFQFAVARYLDQTLLNIEKMPDEDIDQIISKYLLDVPQRHRSVRAVPAPGLFT